MDKELLILLLRQTKEEPVAILSDLEEMTNKNRVKSFFNTLTNKGLNFQKTIDNNYHITQEQRWYFCLVDLSLIEYGIVNGNRRSVFSVFNPTFGDNEPKDPWSIISKLFKTGQYGWYFSSRISVFLSIYPSLKPLPVPGSQESFIHVTDHSREFFHRYGKWQ